MSRAVLLAAQKDWMPNLLTEVPNYHKGIKPRLPDELKSRPVPSPLKATPGYKSLPDGEPLVFTPSPHSNKKTSVPTQVTKPTRNDLLTEQNTNSSSSSPTRPLSGSKNDNLTGAGLLTSSAGKSAEATTATPSAVGTITPVEPKKGEEWEAAGGWYRPENGFTIFYRPSGHADVFFMAWLTAAAQMDPKVNGSEARDIFEKLADPNFFGICMKCHTADKSGNSIVVNWLPAHPEPNLHPFTTFKHTSHFSVTGDKGCQTCHVLNPNSNYSNFFGGDTRSDADPHRFESNFKPLLKAACIECHKPKIAGDACLMCHQYHTGIFGAKVVGEGKMEGDLVKTK
jgi:hypothetical protein